MKKMSIWIVEKRWREWWPDEEEKEWWPVECLDGLIGGFTRAEARKQIKHLKQFGGDDFRPDEVYFRVFRYWREE